MSTTDGRSGQTERNSTTCLDMLGDDPPDLEGARVTVLRTPRDGSRASEVIKRLRVMFSHQQLTTELVDLNDAAREVLALSSSEEQICRRPRRDRRRVD